MKLKKGTPKLHERGTWWPLHVPSGVHKAAINCPSCHQTSYLIDHEIDEHGTVAPSVVCPTEGCTFHEHVVLEGWE